MVKRAFRLAAVIVSAVTLLTAATSQTTNPVCTVGSVTNTPNGCPTVANGGHWSSNIPAANCFHATVSCTLGNAEAAQDIGITFGYAQPSGTTNNGLIVFLSPEGGTMASVPVSSCPMALQPCYSDIKYFDDYLTAQNPYEVMQTQWDSDWEDTGVDGNGNPYPINVGYAAARWAGFLSWVNTNYYVPIYQNNIHAGMCTQGNSAGGGAAAYILAWYGGSIDHAEFLSSPPLSDIEQGCFGTPHGPNPVTICSVTNQLGCSGVTPWTASAYYTNALDGVRGWADINSDPDNTCRGPVQTSYTADEQWKDMSIVDDGVFSTFSYPSTSMTAWLCSSTYPGTPPMNNSSSQAQLFFGNFTMASQLHQPNGLLINGVANCNGSEDVTNALTKQLGANRSRS